MKIYIDNEFKCHITNDGTMTAVESTFFDDKCDTFIEGYRFIPADKSWIRDDGTVFIGEMVAPWKNYSELDAVQREYERALLEDMRQALNELGVYA